MDALHDAHTALQVDGLHLCRALFGGKIVDGQHGLARLAELPQALLDERQIQRIGVIVVQRAVRQARIELCAFEEIIQTDHLRRGTALSRAFAMQWALVVLPLADGPVSMTIFAPESCDLLGRRNLPFGHSCARSGVQVPAGCGLLRYKDLFQPVVSVPRS